MLPPSHGGYDRRLSGNDRDCRCDARARALAPPKPIGLTINYLPLRPRGCDMLRQGFDRRSRAARVVRLRSAGSQRSVPDQTYRFCVRTFHAEEDAGRR